MAGRLDMWQKTWAESRTAPMAVNPHPPPTCNGQPCDGYGLSRGKLSHRIAQLQESQHSKQTGDC